MLQSQFTEDNKVWQASRPKKSVAVKVIMKSDMGNVLLVKPTYKDAWQFPGGGVEVGEAPEESLTREISEELGLEAAMDDLQLVGNVFRRDYDCLLLMYEYRQKVRETVQLTLPPAEIAAYEFVAPHIVPTRVSGYYKDFWRGYQTRL